jgi:8-oxo-dGTP diphosphatase
MTSSLNHEPKKHGVVAVLDDGGGKFLFIRRGLQLKRAPGWWCFVGGEVEPGEELSDAMAREVLEEVGLRVFVHEKVHESISPNGEYRLHWFRAELADTPQALETHPHEVAEARWLSAEEGLLLEPILPGLKIWLENRLRR